MNRPIEDDDVSTADLQRAKIQLSRLSGLVVHPTFRVTMLGWSEGSTLMVANIGRIGQLIAQSKDEFNYEAAILCRSLFEHVVKFCWLSIDPNTNFDRWLRTDVEHRKKAINDATSRGVPDVSRLAVPPVPAAAPMPNLAELCEDVDRYWGSRLPEFGLESRYSIRSLYIAIYRQYSAVAHCEALGLQTLVQVDIDGGITPDLSAKQLRHAVTIAPVLVGLSFVIANEVLGSPAKESIHQIFEQTM